MSRDRPWLGAKRAPYKTTVSAECAHSPRTRHTCSRPAATPAACASDDLARLVRYVHARHPPRAARSPFSRRHEHARARRDVRRVRTLTAHTAHLFLARSDAGSARHGQPRGREHARVGGTWPQRGPPRAPPLPAPPQQRRPQGGLPRRHPTRGTRRARSHRAPRSTHEGREKKRRHTFSETMNLYRPAGGVTPRTAPGFSVAPYILPVLMWPRLAARSVAALMLDGIGAAAYLPPVAHKRSPRLAFTRRRRGARDGKVCIHRLCLVIQTRFIRKEGGERLR
jgi:hypothetical protein